MLPTHSGSFRLFRFSGITVFLHWSWFVVGIIAVSTRSRAYESPLWNVAEYVALFLIVLLHEFGHALACRQTGGQANEIVLWPLGGIAFVKPPPRAAAELWSIAAGPLVNVLLIPVFFGLIWFGSRAGWGDRVPDAMEFLGMLWLINNSLLVFNLLPLYPLDGGQILRSLLWFPLGRARSLHVASIIGLIGIVSLGGYAIYRQPDRFLWIGFMGFFLGQQCLVGFRTAQYLLTLNRAPRHRGFFCPSCREAPIGGPLLPCQHCGNAFDPFSTQAVCPHCARRNATTRCLHCGNDAPIERWTSIDVQASSERP